MRIEPRFETMGRPETNQRDAEERARAEKEPTEPRQNGAAPQQPQQKWEEQNGEKQSGGDVEEDDEAVGNRCGGIAIQVNSAEREGDYRSPAPAFYPACLHLSKTSQSHRKNQRPDACTSGRECLGCSRRALCR